MDPDETPAKRRDGGPRRGDGQPLPGDGFEALQALGRTFWAADRHALAITDRAGAITAWSPGAELLSGLAAADVLGRPLGVLRGEEGEEATARLLAQAEREPVSGGSWRVHPDGTRWWAESLVFPLHGEGDGSILGFAELLHDRTAEVVAEAADAEVERRFAEALRAGEVAVFRQDADLRYTWGVNAIPELTEPMDAIIGTRDADFLPADVAAQLTERKREILRTRTRARFDIVAEQNGYQLFHDVTIAPLLDADGTVVGLTGVAVNVTEQRVAAELLRRSARRLAEAETLAQIGSWERDLTRGKSYWSPGIFALYGLDPRTAVPGLDLFLGMVHPDDREQVGSVIREAELSGGSYEIEHRIVRTDGRVRWVNSRAEVLAPSEDGPLRIAGTARDVTEAHRVGIALRDAAERISPRKPEGAGALDAKLSSRQLEVLALVADGLSNRDIADRLFISEATVKWHMRQILRALGVSNRAQAVARYLRAGPAGGER